MFLILFACHITCMSLIAYHIACMSLMCCKQL